MGKQITIIDFYDGNNEKRIPSIVDEVIGESRDVKHFFERIDQVLLNLEPKVSVFSGDWDDLRKISKKEPEATVSVFSGDWDDLRKISKKEPEAT
jgi:phage gp37-like protein